VEGEFVEPVQLQVVCYQLWEDLKDQPGDHITLENLSRLARGQDLAQFVNRALADFYQDTLQKVLHQTGLGVSEKMLREWFSTQLITEAGTRGFVFMGEHSTGGIPNKAVQLLEGQLLRGESRAGGKWYELVHDRFVDPILQSNREWALAQQRRSRTIAIGVGFMALISVLVLAFTTNLFASQARQSSAVAMVQASLAVQNATQASYAQGTAYANATQADIALSAAKTSRADAAGLYQDQAQATITLAALQFASTAQAAQVQLTALQPTLYLASPTPTPGEVRDTPTPTPSNERATPTPKPSSNKPTPTLDKVATIQLATAAALQFQLDNIKATQTALASPVRELRIGLTGKGSTIWVTQLGNGTRNIVLVGGMHAGFAPGTVDLAQAIVDYYSKNVDQIPPGIKLHVITNANPDSPASPGELAGRLNSAGVDLNRNWDCDWKKNATWRNTTVSGGTKPFSEPETQVLREYFLRTQPVAVVFWEARAQRGQASPGGCGLQSLFSESLAQIYGKGAGYVVAPFVAYSVNGDATNWLDGQGIPAISVLLPDYESADFDNNLIAVQSLLESYRQ
jgi:hypothetical protein